MLFSKCYRIVGFALLAVFICNMHCEATNYRKGSRSRYKQPKLPNVFMIDNFSDGEFDTSPEWFSFGNVIPGILPVRDQERYLTKYALQLKGQAQQWYVGGFGRYLGIEAGHYTHLKVVIKGSGINSGYIRIELFDDDNRNNRIDLDPNTNRPNADDKFVHSILVDWDGWRVVTVPLSQFGDANPGVGDDALNLYQLAGSAGLLQFQMILTTAKNPVGNVNLLIDQAKLVKM